MILAGDVGGTKVHLALYGFEQGELTHVRDEKFPAQEYHGLDVVAKKFHSTGLCDVCAPNHSRPF